MANFHYFHPADNVAPNATVTTGGSANSAYPLTRLTDFSYANLANPSKLAGTTGDWILDFGSAQRVDAVMLWHNFDSGLAYTIQMNATNTWSGPPTLNLTTPTAPAKRTDTRTIKTYHDLRLVSGYSTSGKRYLRFNVPGAGSPAVGNSVPLGLKVMAFSGIRQTIRNYRWGWHRDETQTGIRMTTDARVPWHYDLTSSGRVLSFDVPGEEADFPSIAAWVQAAAGFVKPIGMVPDPAVNDFLLGNFTSAGGSIVMPTLDVYRLEAQHALNRYNPMRFVIEEITAGDPEWY
jgi:hypothetical protein